MRREWASEACYARFPAFAILMLLFFAMPDVFFFSLFIFSPPYYAQTTYICCYYIIDMSYIYDSRLSPPVYYIAFDYYAIA